MLLTRGSFSAFLGTRRKRGTSLLRGLAKARLCSTVSHRVFREGTQTGRTFSLVRAQVRNVRLLASRRRGSLHAHLTKARGRLRQIRGTGTRRRTLRRTIHSVRRRVAVHRERRGRTTSGLIRTARLLAITHRRCRGKIRRRRRSRTHFGSLRRRVLRTHGLSVRLSATVHSLSRSRRRLGGMVLQGRRTRGGCRTTILHQERKTRRVTHLAT